MRVFERAIRMSGIDVVYSEGFNPRVKMSIASALPLGATADGELVTVHIAEPVDLKDVVSRLSKSLPVGLPIVNGRILPDNVKGLAVKGSEFIVDVALPDDDSASRLEWAVGEVLSLPEIVVERESGGRRKKFDLRPGIESLEVIEASGLGARISMVLPHREFTVKPSEVVETLNRFLPGIGMVRAHRKRLDT
jgi:radical SAM-linked protein